jgi:hypothetical protein
MSTQSRSWVLMLATLTGAAVPLTVPPARRNSGTPEIIPDYRVGTILGDIGRNATTRTRSHWIGDQRDPDEA